MMRHLLLLAPLPLLLSSCSHLPSWAGGTAKKETPAVSGERVAIIPDEAQLTPDRSLATTAIEIPAAENHADWEQHNGTAGQLSGNPQLAVTLERRQSASVGDGNSFRHKLVPAPVVASGIVYAMDARGLISAHDVKNVSETRWISPGAAADDMEAVLGGGLAYSEGKVFAASGKGIVVALNAATGVELWRQPLNIPVRSAPRVDSGRVYVVTVDSQTFALDAGTGAVLWSHRGVDEGKGFLIEATPAIAGDMVIVPYSSGEVHVLRADSGDEIWADAVIGSQRESAVSLFTGIGADPVPTPDGALYVAGSAGMFAAFQLETGRHVWEQTISSVSTPWVAADSVYVLSTDARLYCLQRMDGRVRWVSQLPAYENEAEKKDPYTWNGPVMAGGRLLVTGAHGQMLEISPQDGSVLSTTEIPDGVQTAPVVAGGVAYMVAQDATLFALY